MAAGWGGVGASQRPSFICNPRRPSCEELLQGAHKRRLDKYHANEAKNNGTPCDLVLKSELLLKYTKDLPGCRFMLTLFCVQDSPQLKSRSQQSQEDTTNGTKGDVLVCLFWLPTLNKGTPGLFTPPALQQHENKHLFQLRYEGQNKMLNKAS